MESQPQNPEFRINPENFQPWKTHLQIRCDLGIDMYTNLLLLQ